MSDKAEVEDAMLDAQTEFNRIMPDIYAEWYQSDLLLTLAVQAATMPDDAWRLVDEDTKQGVVEVLRGK